MSMFSMGGVKSVSIAPNYLKSGIHKVYFKGIEKFSGTVNGIELKFEAVDGSGIHNERIFEPKSDVRTESKFGQNPSESEQFLLKIGQIISALDSELYKKIEKNGENFQAPDFDGFVNLVKKYLDPKINTETSIKLIPRKGNYVGFPNYIASINKNGDLYINNKFIGDNLVLSAKEIKLINEAANAKPTNMANNDELEDLQESFKENNEDDDDMPF